MKVAWQKRVGFCGGYTVRPRNVLKPLVSMSGRVAVLEGTSEPWRRRYALVEVSPHVGPGCGVDAKLEVRGRTLVVNVKHEGRVREKMRRCLGGTGYGPMKLGEAMVAWCAWRAGLRRDEPYWPGRA